MPAKAVNPTLQSLVDAHPEPFALVDADYNVVAANARYVEVYLGQGAQSVAGFKCHQVSHKSDSTCEINGEECPLQRVFETSAPHQVMHRHFDCGHHPDYVAIHASPILGEDGRVLYMGESITSITHQKDCEFDAGKMVAGCCPSFMGVLANLGMVAETSAPVLIYGETGSGKELAAQFIHRKSPRERGPFVAVDCTQFTEEMFTSELFGHGRGAFTGALSDRQGLIGQAEGGSLFMDEIGEMPLSLQAKLLRVMETRTYRRLGENQVRNADVRFICATHRDLQQMVAAGTFRRDLYYRLNTMQVELPPLRHRREDIPELIKHFLALIVPRVLGMTAAAQKALVGYDFPGNVRELRNILERAAILSRGGVIDVQQLPQEVIYPRMRPVSPRPLHAESHFYAMPSGDRTATPAMIQAVLARHGGNRRLAAQDLGMSERTLYRKLRALA